LSPISAGDVRQRALQALSEKPLSSLIIAVTPDSLDLSQLGIFTTGLTAARLDHMREAAQSGPIVFMSGTPAGHPALLLVGKQGEIAAGLNRLVDSVYRSGSVFSLKDG
jgi:hypothetical protein